MLQILKKECLHFAIKNHGTLNSLCEISKVITHGDILLKEDGTIKVDVNNFNKVSGQKWRTVEIPKNGFIILQYQEEDNGTTGGYIYSGVSNSLERYFVISELERVRK